MSTTAARTSRTWFLVLASVLALRPALARAQAEPDEPTLAPAPLAGTSSPWRSTLAERRSMAGTCGAIRSYEDGTRETEVDPRFGHGLDLARSLFHAYRGVGSPAHGAELELGIAHSQIGLRETTATWIDARSTLVNSRIPDLRRACITVGARARLVTGDGDASIAGNVGLRLGLLSRTQADSFRLHVEAEIVVPSAMQDARPVALQSRLHGALTAGVDDDLGWLGPLEWGARGIVSLDIRLGPDHPAPIGIWLPVTLSVGGARVASEFGTRDALVGGLRLGLRLQASLPFGYSFRVGGEAAASFGSVYPTDVIYPAELDALVGVAMDLHWAIDVRVGGVFARWLPDPERPSESGLRGDVRFTVVTDWAVGDLLGAADPFEIEYKVPGQP